eukprot:247094-Pelagomonas_calceolata.AAC.1
MSDFTGGDWGSVMMEGPHQDGCGRGRKSPRQLAHAASCCSPIWHRVAGEHDASIATKTGSIGGMAGKRPTDL